MVWQSFSGDHPYSPECLVEVLDPTEIRRDCGLSVAQRIDQITALIEDGTCPRCLQPLPASTTWLPAGSHATACRCVPVCGTCGTHESLTGLIRPEYWPLDGTAVTAYVAKVLARPEPAILDTDTGALIGEDGALGQVRLPPEHPER